MNNEFWNAHYGTNEYAYGTEPNDFLKEQTFPSNGKILCLAEGEGRNSVFLAKQGYEVTGVDFSQAGIEKINRLAEENGVEVTTICADLAEFDCGENNWDGIVLIFAHLPLAVREKVHHQLYNALKPGGKLVVEAYRKEQLEYQTGGPKTFDLLYSKELLATDFNLFRKLSVAEKTRDVHEGKYHFGTAAVVQVVGVK
jgi:SAM-dependent methyltransferase